MLRAVRPPDPVGPGGHIRVVSPGLPTLAHVPERGERAEAALHGLGYRVSFSEHAFGMAADGITSGTPAERAGDLLAAFADPGVDAVLISDSGTGSRDLLALLDPEVLARTRKPLIGFCDTVYLHHHLALAHGTGSYYGCSLVVHLGDAPGPFPETVDYLGRALALDSPLRCRPVGPRARPLATWHDPKIESAPRERDYPAGWTWLREGSCEAPLYGGEISQLPGVVKEFGLDYTGALFFWDITEEQTRPLGELLERLCSATDLRRLAGMVVGANPNMDPQDWAELVAAELARQLPDADYPVLVNSDLSHAAPSWTVPFGEQAVLDPVDGLVFPRHGAR
ncbi:MULTISPECIES: LD-carboxypeptidase [Kitasatospora]|uniref:LD-carboxypeptidase n=1 Tax=Kitasatospora TaxID=2063 RepID=UPI000C7064EE|nr:LD-carboxypeptidase [Kitasatospora sp. GP30]MDH6140351.1 muramoyltetrapeptide carboxypeptidase [Kitasatospora sp. GP30]